MNSVNATSPTPVEVVPVINTCTIRATITTKGVSSNPAHGEVYTIQHYVIRLPATGRWFYPGTPVFSESD